MQSPAPNPVSIWTIRCRLSAAAAHTVRRAAMADFWAKRRAATVSSRNRRASKPVSPAKRGSATAARTPAITRTVNSSTKENPSGRSRLFLLKWELESPPGHLTGGIPSLFGTLKTTRAKESPPSLTDLPVRRPLTIAAISSSRRTRYCCSSAGCRQNRSLCSPSCRNNSDSRHSWQSWFHQDP